MAGDKRKYFYIVCMIVCLKLNCAWSAPFGDLGKLFEKGKERLSELSQDLRLKSAAAEAYSGMICALRITNEKIEKLSGGPICTRRCIATSEIVDDGKVLLINLKVITASGELSSCQLKINLQKSSSGYSLLGDSNYNYHDNEYTLGDMLTISVDPLGKTIWSAKVDGLKCNDQQLPFSYDSENSFLGLNGGLIFRCSKRSDTWITRTTRLGTTRNFKLFNEQLQSRNLEPIIPAECISKYHDLIESLKVAGKKHTQINEEIETIRSKIRSDETCSKFIYADNPDQSNIPIVAYLHMRGFGKGGETSETRDSSGHETEDDFALREYQFALVFGYKLKTPFSGEDPVGISGTDLFRPVLYYKTDDGQKRVFAGQEEELLRRGIVPPLHFYNDKTFDNYMSDEGRAMAFYDLVGGYMKTHSQMDQRLEECKGVDDKSEMEKLNACARAIISERQKDVTHLGGIEGYLNLLEMAADPKNQRLAAHCYGGRHKTGNFALGMKYLLGPQWFYGRRKDSIMTGHKEDTEFNEQLTLDDLHHNLTASEERHSLPPVSMRHGPAEREYLGFNRGVMRNVNLQSVKDLFRLLYEPENKVHRDYLKEKYGLLDSQIDGIIKRLIKIKSMMVAKTHCS